jgi:iron complex transport system ATP-binding protein
VPPFSEIDESSASEVVELMRAAEVVIICDAPFGPGNVRNLEAAAAAAAAGTRVVLLEQIPPRERDFTEGRATRLWERLAGRAEVVRSYEALFAAVGGSAASSGRAGRSES